MACLRGHGMEPQYHHKIMGWNARLDALQAALLRVKLPHLDTLDRATASGGAALRCADRRRASDTLLAAADGASRSSRHVFNQYVVRVARGQRDALMHHLKADKIGCEIYYPVPLHLQECLAYLGYRRRRLPGQRRGGAIACWHCRCSRKSPASSSGAWSKAARPSYARKHAGRHNARVPRLGLTGGWVSRAAGCHGRLGLTDG